jgi:flagellar biosynthesis GTPase FlhF
MKKYARRATIGVMGVAAVGFGAPALGVVAASAGLLALRDRRRSAPQRAQANLESFREYQAREAARVAEESRRRIGQERERAAEEDRAKRQIDEYNQRTEAARAEEQAQSAAAEESRMADEAQRAADRRDASERLREWQEGTARPTEKTYNFALLNDPPPEGNKTFN